MAESLSVSSFLDVGQRSVAHLARALEGTGQDLGDSRRILDFGCGCARTLRWLPGLTPLAALYGTDVDAQAIAWDRQHFPEIIFSVNRPEPPLSFPAGNFDLVYSISVFTHLDQPLQERWIAELERVTASGALLLVTVHGEATWHGLPMEDVEQLRQQGFLFKRSSKWRGILPDWYHTAYHSRAHAVEAFGRHFEVVSYVPEGFGYQDLLVLRKR
ncbi:MAG: class I SAM-dependent methyltransferase [Acidobacteria bacterium]|nr:class I SAM-dependent methyltransferase [Acidobacteriota bacterium]